MVLEQVECMEHLIDQEAGMGPLLHGLAVLGYAVSACRLCRLGLMTGRG